MTNRRGTEWETAVVRTLREALGDARIERRARSGRKDRGDIAGLTLGGRRVVAECKAVRGLSIAAALGEAEREAVNDGPDSLPVAISKQRRGPGCSGAVETAIVSMRLRDFVRLLGEPR